MIPDIMGGMGGAGGITGGDSESKIGKVDGKVTTGEKNFNFGTKASSVNTLLLFGGLILVGSIVYFSNKKG